MNTNRKLIIFQRLKPLKCEIIEYFLFITELIPLKIKFNDKNPCLNSALASPWFQFVDFISRLTGLIKPTKKMCLTTD